MSINQIKEYRPHFNRSVCHQCKKPLNKKRKKHHCRFCFKPICNDCTIEFYLKIWHKK